MTDGEPLSYYLDALEGLSAPPAAALPAIQLATAVRRLAAAAVTSSASTSELASIEHLVAELADRLEASRGDVVAGQWALQLAGPRGRYLFQPTYGPANPLAPSIRVTYERGQIVARTSFGYPAEGRFGTAHWANVTAPVLGLVSLASVTGGRRGTLRTFDVRYLTPASLDEEVVYRVRITEATEDSTLISASVTSGEDDVLNALAVLDQPTPRG